MVKVMYNDKFLKMVSHLSVLWDTFMKRESSVKLHTGHIWNRIWSTTVHVQGNPIFTHAR